MSINRNYKGARYNPNPAANSSLEGNLVFEVTGIKNAVEQPWIIKWLGVKKDAEAALLRAEPLEYYELACKRGYNVRAFFQGLDVTRRLGELSDQMYLGTIKNPPRIMPLETTKREFIP